MNPQDFASKVVFIRSRFLGIPRRTTWLLIEWRETVRRKRICIITDGDIEVAIRVHE
jgi:hypothetical protein